MVVGSGDIASVLPDSEKLFFASGVSNSQETRESEFKREVDLLNQQDSLQHIVYFSSLSVFYADTPYTRHKLDMEKRIKRFPTWTIIRLGNIDWGTNPNTLINYLKAHPDAEIRDEFRYVITQPEFLHWISLIPDWSCEMNCPGAWMKVEEIYDEYVA